VRARTKWAVGFLILCLVALLTYAVPRGFGSNKRDRFATTPERRESVTIQIPELCPSSGLAWSKEAFPAQYAPANWKSVDLDGLKPSEDQRLLDIGGRIYSPKFLSQFSYTGSGANRPQVRLHYLRRADTFVGKLTARGLKPNFAYQLKLKGTFADRASFERIGYLGRWRLPGRGTNYLDKDYEGFAEKHLVRSYLLFDFMVTDPSGNAEKEFYADSSLHVLWNATNQRGPSQADSRPILFTREGGDVSLYLNPSADLSPQSIYAESEQHALADNNRPPIGEAFLPPGRYQAEFVLTEESFHGFGDNGFWATVMGAPVEFEIVPIRQPRPSRYWSAHVPVKASLSLEHASVRNIEETRRTAESLEGVGAGKQSALRFAERINFAPGERYLLAADILASGRHTWSIYVDNGHGFGRKATHTIESRGRSGWQRFEVEITSAVAGRIARIRIVPATEPGPIGIRNVGLHKITAAHPITRAH